MARVASEVAVHVGKARDSALLAVETYNRPGTRFRSGGYIVLMCIAWTALFHAIFFKRGVKPFYRKKSNRRHFEIVDGDKKAWELSQCLIGFWGPHSSPVRTNLEFFVKLRNKIEHRSMPGIDINIFGECQALLFNFEDLLVGEFGNKYALNESLSLALQFSCYRHENQQTATRKLHKRLAKDVVSYINEFRSSLSIAQLQDMQFSYKVFLIPKPANHAGSADVAVEFVKYDPNNPEEMDRINRIVALIKTPGATIAQPATERTTELEGVRVRVVTDRDAIPVRAVNYDDTHPLSQARLIDRVNELLPDGDKINSYDLMVVKYAHDIADKRDYYYKSNFGSTQYSESYARWLAFCYQEDRDFFLKARTKYYDDRH
jgi:hypothetical protein